MNCNTPSGTRTHTGVCLPVWDCSYRSLHPGSQVCFAHLLSSCLHTLSKNLQLCFKLDSQKCFSILKPQILIWPESRSLRGSSNSLGERTALFLGPITTDSRTKMELYSVSPFQSCFTQQNVF